MKKRSSQTSAGTYRSPIVSLLCQPSMSCIFFSFFEGEEEDPGNFRVSPTSIPGNILEQIIEQSAYKNLEDNKMTKKRRQNRSIKNRSYQNNLIFFTASATSSADKAEAVNRDLHWHFWHHPTWYFHQQNKEILSRSAVPFLRHSAAESEAWTGVEQKLM